MAAVAAWIVILFLRMDGSGEGERLEENLAGLDRLKQMLGGAPLWLAFLASVCMPFLWAFLRKRRIAEELRAGAEQSRVLLETRALLRQRAVGARAASTFFLMLATAILTGGAYFVLFLVPALDDSDDLQRRQQALNELKALILEDLAEPHGWFVLEPLGAQAIDRLVPLSGDGTMVLAFSTFGSVAVTCDGARSWRRLTEVESVPLFRGREPLLDVIHLKDGVLLLVGAYGSVLRYPGEAGNPKRRLDELAGQLNCQGMAQWGAIQLASQGQLDKTDELGGGAVVSEDVLFLQSQSGSFVVSNDDGLTWLGMKELRDRSYLDKEEELLFSMLSSDHKDIVVIGSEGRVARSLDRGATWASTDLASLGVLQTGDDVLDYWVSQDARRIVILGGQGDVAVSANGGASWDGLAEIRQSAQLGPEAKVSSVEAWPEEGMLVLASQDGSVAFSPDWGTTWATPWRPDQAAAWGRFFYFDVAARFSSSAVILWRDDDFYLQTNDSGLSWATIDTLRVGGQLDSGERIRDLAVLEGHELVTLIGTEARVSISRNAGAIWDTIDLRQKGLFLAQEVVRESRIHNDAGIVAIWGTLGSFALSVDGGRNWRGFSAADRSSAVRDLVVGGRTVVLVGRDGIAVGETGGENWTPIKLQEAADYPVADGIQVLVSQDGEVLAAVSYSGSLAVSTDRGRSWAGWHLRERGDLLSEEVVTAVTLAPDGEWIGIGGDAGSVAVAPTEGGEWHSLNIRDSNSFAATETAASFDFLAAGVGVRIYGNQGGAAIWPEPATGRDSLLALPSLNEDLFLAPLRYWPDWQPRVHSAEGGILHVLSYTDGPFYVLTGTGRSLALVIDCDRKRSARAKGTCVADQQSHALALDLFRVQVEPEDGGNAAPFDLPAEDGGGFAIVAPRSRGLGSEDVLNARQKVKGVDWHPAFAVKEIVLVGLAPNGRRDGRRVLLLTEEGQLIAYGTYDVAEIGDRVSAHLGENDLTPESRLTNLSGYLSGKEVPAKLGLLHSEMADLTGKTLAALEERAQATDNDESELQKWLGKSTLPRIFSIIVIFYVVHLLVRLYQYHSRLAGFFEARADGLLLEPHYGKSHQSMELKELIAVLSPESVQYGDLPKNASEEVVEIAKAALAAKK